MHVLQQKRYGRLMVIDLALVLGLLFLKALHEVVNLALLLVEDLVLLSLTVLSAGVVATTASLFLLKVLLNLLDVSLVGLDHLADICDILLKLLDLGIVLLDSVE